jgi:tetratricopeptide (TPR) repeat protein
LIDVADGAHLWSETYDRTLTDVFAVQDDVAAEILGALQIHVGSAPSRGRPTENTDAYAQFLKAKAAMNRWEAESAEEFLLQAVELDPNFAEAWEMLAYAYWERWGNTMDAVTAQPLMSNAAIKALAIDPELELARVFLNTAESEATWVLREIEELERILSVDPNNAVAVEILIWDLQFAGYFEESLHISERAVERDPLSPNAQFNLFSALNMTGRDSEALATLELADELNANTAKLSLALFHHLAQRFDLAIEYHEAYLKERKLPYGWVQDLHLGAIDPETGQAHLDRRIPEILASVPEDRTFEMKLELSVWYLTYGFLDRYFELIFQSDTPEILVANGIFGRDSGFIAHPRFIEIAEAMVLVDLWDKRGPPDFCEKVDGEWVCE